MSAQIIAFPRLRPLQAHELPAHWPEAIRVRYSTLTHGGYMPHSEVFAYCDELAPVADGPLLERARVAIGHLKPRRA